MHVPPDALELMRERKGVWAAYQNMELYEGPLAGHFQFLRIGPECTHTNAPNCMPDTSYGCGWKYLHVGYVNLDTGDIRDSLEGDKI